MMASLSAWVSRLRGLWEVRDLGFHPSRDAFGGFPKAVENDQERSESVRFRVTISVEGETEKLAATLRADDAKVISGARSRNDNRPVEIGPIYLEIEAEHPFKPSEAVRANVESVVPIEDV
jgi:hypothetical protein